MDINFALSGLFEDGSSPVLNAESLEILLECLIALDVAYLRTYPQTPLLRSPRMGVVYKLTDDWLSIPDLYLRGHGDCKSLSAMRIAELRVRGKVAKPVFRFRPEIRQYHILVQTGVNRFQDPSKECGMKTENWSTY